MEPYDGFAVCSEYGHRDMVMVKPPFIVTDPSVSGTAGMFAPDRPGDVIEC